MRVQANLPLHVSQSDRLASLRSRSRLQPRSSGALIGFRRRGLANGVSPAFFSNEMEKRKTTEENKEKRKKKSEATQFRRPLLRNPELSSGFCSISRERTFPIKQNYIAKRPFLSDAHPKGSKFRICSTRTLSIFGVFLYI